MLSWLSRLIPFVADSDQWKWHVTAKARWIRRWGTCFNKRVTFCHDQTDRFQWRFHSLKEFSHKRLTCIITDQHRCTAFASVWPMRDFWIIFFADLLPCIPENQKTIACRSTAITRAKKDNSGIVLLKQEGMVMKMNVSTVHSRMTENLRISFVSVWSPSRTASHCGGDVVAKLKKMWILPVLNFSVCPLGRRCPDKFFTDWRIICMVRSMLCQYAIREKWQSIECSVIWSLQRTSARANLAASESTRWRFWKSKRFSGFWLRCATGPIHIARLRRSAGLRNFLYTFSCKLIEVSKLKKWQ